jgi:hypothetical protein
LPRALVMVRARQHSTGRRIRSRLPGASLSATLVLAASELEGRALNLHTPGDLAGNYIAVGGAIVGGRVSSRRPRNRRRFELQPRVRQGKRDPCHVDALPTYTRPFIRTG